MDIKSLKSGNPKFLIRFDHKESLLLSSMASEDIYRLSTGKETEFSKEYTYFIGRLSLRNPKSRRGALVPFNDLKELATRLENFSSRTDEEVDLLPELTGIPAFANRYIGLRKQLGIEAVQMAATIRESDVQESVNKIDIGLSHLLAERGESE
jgi:hypothetical protein